jgi:hypothetical protein
MISIARQQKTANYQSVTDYSQCATQALVEKQARRGKAKSKPYIFTPVHPAMSVNKTRHYFPATIQRKQLNAYALSLGMDIPQNGRPAGALPDVWQIQALCQIPLFITSFHTLPPRHFFSPPPFRRYSYSE